MSKKSMSGRPVIFGEVLFDQFPDGSTVLGGAPFNVAWHLRGFGLNPLMVSRIGSDFAGQEILMLMREWGLGIQGVQIDTEHPTGAVQVELQHGQPTYTILPDQAYDYISYSLLKSCLAQQDVSIVYHGSLAARSKISRSTLEQLVAENKALRFVDINLREPWWDKSTMAELFIGADWLKLNDHELTEIVEVKYNDDSERELYARETLSHFNLGSMVLTEGARGACIISAQDIGCGASIEVEDMQDTVGAGDAFSAVCLLGFCKGWDDSRILGNALEFSAKICEYKGATPNDPQLYSDCLMRWVNSD